MGVGERGSTCRYIAGISKFYLWDRLSPSLSIYESDSWHQYQYVLPDRISVESY